MAPTTDLRPVPTSRFGRRRSPTSKSRREALWGLVFIGPWLIGLAVFTAGPLIASLVLSFTNYDLVHPDATAFVGIDNYATSACTGTTASSSTAAGARGYSCWRGIAEREAPVNLKWLCMDGEVVAVCGLSWSVSSSLVGAKSFQDEIM